MLNKSALIAVGLLAIGSTGALAQAGGGAGAESPRLGDANPPRNALRNGGVPPTTIVRRGDDMAPMAGQSQPWQSQSWNGGWRNGWDNGYSRRTAYSSNGWNNNGWNGGWNSGWQAGWSNGWNNRNVSDPSFSSHAGLRAARRSGRCVEDLGYGRYEYCGW